MSWNADAEGVGRNVIVVAMIEEKMNTEGSVAAVILQSETDGGVHLQTKVKRLVMIPAVAAVAALRTTERTVSKGKSGVILRVTEGAMSKTKENEIEVAMTTEIASGMGVAPAVPLPVLIVAVVIQIRTLSISLVIFQ